MIASRRWPRHTRRSEESMGSETQVPESSRPRCSTLASIFPISRSGSNPTIPAIPHIYFCVFCAFLWLDLEWLALAEGVEHAKCNAACCCQIIQTDQRWTTFKHI